jgi:hypothetical protein
MGCIIALLARLALLYVWLATPLINRTFPDNLLLPILGIIFLPLTTLVYVLVFIPGIGLNGWGWFWVILALLVDLGSHSSGAYSNRHRIPKYKRPREETREEKAY